MAGSLPAANVQAASNQDTTVPLPIGSTTVQEAYIKASNSDKEDFFGASIAVSGDRVAVGALAESSCATGIDGNQNNDDCLDAGAVYVFRKKRDKWVQEAYIKASNTDGSDLFGFAVALSGDTLVVTADSESSCATGVGGDQTNNSCSNSGAAYVFRRQGKTWVQEAYLKASNTDASDNFGSAVALSSDRIAIGSEFEDSCAKGVNGDQTDNNCKSSGAVYLFHRDQGTWRQEAYIKASNAEFADYFGSAVALHENKLLVGAYGEDSCSKSVNGDQNNNGCTTAGAAYAFQRKSGTWAQKAYLKASNAERDDRFGYSVAAAADWLAVAADLEASCATGIGGAQKNNNCAKAGAVYAFRPDGNSWQQDAYIKPQYSKSYSNAGYQSYNSFGRSVAMDGDRLLAGAPGDESCASGVNDDQDEGTCAASGAAYLFERAGQDWVQRDYLKPYAPLNPKDNNPNGNSAYQFGREVALSGMTFAVSSPNDRICARGVNPARKNEGCYESGAAYLYDIGATLVGLTIKGPAKVDEEGGANYDAIAEWSDGRTDEVTAIWSEDSPNATIDSAGKLKTGAVDANKRLTVKAKYSENGVTKTATMAVTIVDTTPHVVSLAIKGPNKVNEKTTVDYDTIATWSDGTVDYLVVSWSEDSSYAKVNKYGELISGAVPEDQTLRITVSYNDDGKTIKGEKSVTIVNTGRVIAQLGVEGPARVGETGSAQYRARAYWDDGDTEYVTANWSVDSAYAEIDQNGKLTTHPVPGKDQLVLVGARFSDDEGSAADGHKVTILDTGLFVMSLDIKGPDSLRETGTANYKAVATFDDGSQDSLDTTWEATSDHAEIDDKGKLTVDPLVKNEEATLRASYNSNNGFAQTLGSEIAELTVLLQNDVAGDFDGDGTTDIFWHNPKKGMNKLWRIEDAALIASEKIPPFGKTTKVAKRGDLNGDGMTDIVWRDTKTGRNRLWIMDGHWRLTDEVLPPLKNPDWEIAAVADFTGDNKADIFWHNGTTGANSLWEMDGTTRLSKGPLPEFANSNWQPLGAADFNGDGKADILWHDATRGLRRLWLMHGYERLANKALLYPLAKVWALAGLGDFNKDGKADILWHNTVKGGNQIWLMDGSNREAKGAIPRFINNDWQVAQVGNFDNDEEADILWRNQATGANQLWLMQGLIRNDRSLLPKVKDTNWQVQN